MEKQFSLNRGASKKQIPISFMVLAALFVASQLSYAGVIDSYVTNLGNLESTYHHDSYVGNWWTSDRDGNNASYWYVNYMPGNGSGTTWTYLQVALPMYTGNITAAMLYIDVTASSSGNSALLYHTLDSSLATGDAMQGLTGNQLVQTINNPANGWLGLDVTSFILNDYSNSYAWAAFEFAPAGGNGVNSNFSFSIAAAGSTPAIPGNAPFLRITTDAVPEPGTLLLFALGGTALLLRARKA